MDILQRRSHQLIVQELGVEAIIYDEQTHEAFCLSAPAKAVWLMCEGVSRADVVGRATSEADLSEDAITRILGELERCGILITSTAVSSGPAKLPLLRATQYSRRALVSQLATGAVMAVPFIAAIVAPPAAQAYTGCTIKIGGKCILANQAGTQQAQQRHVRRRISEE